MKRKLQMFYNGNMIISVIESHVKQIMKMATDGEFTELKYHCVFEDNNWYVVFTYKTNYGKGKVQLKAQKIQLIG